MFYANIRCRTNGGIMAVKKKAKKRDEALAGIDDGCESWLVEGARFDAEQASGLFVWPKPRAVCA